MKLALHCLVQLITFTVVIEVCADLLRKCLGHYVGLVVKVVELYM